MEEHKPVLIDEVIKAISPRDGAIYVDGTFGGGSYSRAILDKACCKVIGIDRDPMVDQLTRSWRSKYEDRLLLLQGCFGDMESLLVRTGVGEVDGIALDLGVSSFQLDRPERGFSLKKDGPLDMRMSKNGTSATQVINEHSEEDIADIIFNYGEERRARRIARAITRARKETPITRTLQLAQIVRRCFPNPHLSGSIDCATRTFQALRIFINDELGELERGLNATERLLKKGGIIAIVSFHSLEDRLVKKFFVNRSRETSGLSRHSPPQIDEKAPSLAINSHRPIRPSETETRTNPRARSARLRVATKLGVSADKTGNRPS
ncbi:MAG: 16S rRNA (cytosine(1402)-N(4))-methyltransferase RsmH [Pseudomonadota bacterium]|nr:16S rRNA (cytosine(1402)-N(4))-methyltransferase RsmH [Pseudomonadota bacterium]